jgi:hypothetical protein
LSAIAAATLASVAWPSGSGRATPPAASAACGDLLAEAKRKPAGLVFVGCMALPGRQGRPLRATYRVAGKQAVAVEATLNRTAGLAPLRRFCCQWDGPAGSFTDAAGRSHMISMASGETMVTDRRQWRAIPVFTVIVDRFTEEI